VPGERVQKIAFSSTRDYDPAVLAQPNSWEIYLADPDGTNVVRLTTNVFSDLFAAMSPDGKGRIVFDSNRRNVSGDPINLVELFLMKSDGSNQQYLARGTSASWSPDSQRIAFQRSASGTGLPINPQPGAPAPDSDIFVGSVCDLLAGIPPTNITATNDPTKPSKIDVDPDWSNDGQKIAFTSIKVGDHPQTPTSAEIWVINPDGSGLKQLTVNDVEERAAAWSPDDMRIVYMCKQGTVAPDADNEICVMNADGTGQTQLTFNTLNDATPSFSPDGQKILFHRGGGGTGNTQVWVMNPDGTAPTQITFLPGNSQYASWGFVTR
jgi:TolB protein